MTPQAVRQHVEHASMDSTLIQGLARKSLDSYVCDMKGAVLVFLPSSPVQKHFPKMFSSHPPLHAILCRAEV